MMDRRTSFDPTTHQTVRAILHSAINDRQTILRVFYGDRDTGRDWCEENDTIGFIGRSCGQRQVPLMLEPLRCTGGGTVAACGGGAIIDHCIVRIIRCNDARELYRAERYKVPQFALVAGGVDALARGHRFTVTAQDCGVLATFNEWEAAAEYIAFIQGFKVVRQFRTKGQYEANLRQAA